MKKITVIALLLAAALTLSACGTGDNVQVENGGNSSGNSSGNTAEGNNGASGGENNEDPPAEHVPSEEVLAAIEGQFGGAETFTAPDGTEVKLTDAVSTNGYSLTFDFAYMRYAEPIYSDTVANPEIYDFENFEFTVDNEADIDGTAFKVVKGQKLDNGMTVIRASYTLGPDGPEMNEIELDGEITLEGLLFCYFEEEYGFDQDEVIFYPNPKTGTVPVIYPTTNNSLKTLSGIDLYSEFAFICDGGFLRLGSINDIGKSDWFANGSYVRVKVTLSDLKLKHFFAGSSCYATMKNVEFL